MVSQVNKLLNSDAAGKLADCNAQRAIGSGISPAPDMERWCTSTAKAQGRFEHFAFNLMDKVIIKEIQRPGIVDSLIVDSLGRQYRVVFWNDGTRSNQWLYEWELEAR